MNRLMIRHTMDKPLPYDAEVEYLESSGTQYIDTGITCNTDTDVLQVTFSISSFVSFCGVAGYRVGASDHNFAIGYNQDNAMSADCNNSNYANSRAQISDAVANTDYTIIISRQGRYIYKGDSLVDSNTSTSDIFITGDIYIFAVNGIQNYSQIRVKSVQIERNGVTIMDLMPVRKSNTGYLYDKVSGRLFGNQGTGDFIVGPDYNPFAYQYLTFIPVEDAVFSWAERATSGHLEYSINGGQTWVTIADGESTPTITAGSKVIWRGDLKPAFSTSDIANTAGIGTFSASGNYHAFGNTMSLLFYDNYYDRQLDSNAYRVAFGALFYQDTHILTAPLLPATKLSAYCYINMFRGCSNLVTAVRVLPAMAIPSRGYQRMYYNCTNLRVASILLCNTIGSQACLNMYSNCGNINYIKCLATTIGTYGTSAWVEGLSLTGTFVKAAGMEDWPTGISGIPSGWTVIDDPSTITT